MVSAAFGWQPSQASGVYKWYTSLVYLAPLAGGLLADRLLGLRNAVFIGAVLMAIGHFLMAFPSQPVFFGALVFLILGNGFFKPNISTMVGKMYTAADVRRDRAFTIFYMGINIGAFLSSIVCPLLQETLGFHWGFGAAGVGMVTGLIIFAIGQKRVVADVEAVGNTTGTAKKPPAEPKEKEGAPYREPAREAVVGDEEKPGASGVAGMVGKIYPWVMIAAGPTIVTVYVRKVLAGEAKPILLIMPIAFGAIFIVMGFLLMRLRGAQRDKSVSIFIMFLFPVLFWMAFEQAGNALNLWAVDHTDRFIGMIGRDYPAGWWQSANALMIFILAPLFTIVWSQLAKRKMEPSTPAKMFWAMTMMVASFLVMVVGAASENATESKAALSAVPSSGDLSTLSAGRLRYDEGTKELSLRGVMPPFARRDAFEKTTTPALLEKVEAFEKASAKATKEVPVTQEIDLPRFAFTEDAEILKQMGMTRTDAGATGEKLSFALRHAAEGHTVTVALTANAPLEAQPKAEILEAVAEPEWRKALKDLEKASHRARVSAVWLFLSYLLATLGELCLSPVGLSMVTKLAPARFASLFMGVWLLSSSVAQYVGGSIGESWGQIPPVSYFWIFVGTSVVGTVVVLVFLSPLKKLMHEVR